MNPAAAPTQADFEKFVELQKITARIGVLLPELLASSFHASAYELMNEVGTVIGAHLTTYEEAKRVKTQRKPTQMIRMDTH